MIYFLTAIISLILDQLTKIYILRNFRLYEVRPVINDFFSITYTTNTGGAFGIFSGYPLFFIILSALMVIFSIVFYKKILNLGLSFQLAFGFVLGGTLGNLVDRLLYEGRVVDFIDFNFWPTFNIADIAICIGVGILIVNLVKMENHEDKALQSESESGNITEASGAATNEGSLKSS